MGKTGTAQTTRKTRRDGDTFQLITNRVKSRSYERSTTYMKGREWSAMGVEERYTAMKETHTKSKRS